ncbi:hypothetical protein [Actinoplanes sp. NPDC049265]|uniref:hypothetical protein n=1 Tax=Actinoplanes sp. NPDC049265 TaxID=3363902 RepID=UPI003714E397
MPGRLRKPVPLSTHDEIPAAGRPRPAARGLLELQQTAGNQAVTSLVAQRAPAPPHTAPPPWWPNGPTVARKGQTATLAQYVSWVKQVEAAYPGREEVVHRLRRLYYSDFVAKAPAKGMNPSPSAGPRFDTLIEGNDTPAPMTSPPVSLAALNGLFETDTVTTPAGESIDPTHFLPALDLALQGPSTTGSTLETVSGAPLTGVFTWTGDLGSWFVDWADQKKNNPKANDFQLLTSRAGAKVSIDDLLADLDAQATVKADVTTKVTVHDSGAPEIPPAIQVDRSLNRPLSDILQSLYGTPAAPNAAGTPNRFVRFVKAAVPAIPHVVPDPKKPHEVRLAADAEAKIYDAVYAAAEALLEGNRTITRIGTPAALDQNPHVVKEIARRFRVYLEAGLAGGSATWP